MKAEVGFLDVKTTLNRPWTHETGARPERPRTRTIRTLGKFYLGLYCSSTGAQLGGTGYNNRIVNVKLR